jgi:hypothetical protein
MKIPCRVRMFWGEWYWHRPGIESCGCKRFYIGFLEVQYQKAACFDAWDKINTPEGEQ